METLENTHCSQRAKQVTLTMQLPTKAKVATQPTPNSKANTKLAHSGPLCHASNNKTQRYFIETDDQVERGTE